MNTTSGPLEASLRRLELASGGFAMVALDQRESLREMFPVGSTGNLVDDDELTRFKAEAARVLTPHASGVLLDRPLGIPSDVRPTHVADSCGLLLAADVLHSTRGNGVHGSSLDATITADVIGAVGAAGIKYLVIWRRDDETWRAEIDTFLELAESAGVASFVEGIVRPPLGGAWASPEDRHAAIIEAAVDLSPGASVYKAEVPGYRPGDVTDVEQQSHALTEAIEVPWVVLSNGVRQEDFAHAVERSCAGGASGFLAGRAIWADTVSEPDPAHALVSRSVDRLTNLVSIVEDSTRRRATAKESVR